MAVMRVLMVPDRCGDLTSVQVAGLLEEGWLQANPQVEVEVLPLSSGDGGFLAALEPLGRSEPVVAVDAWGRQVPCSLLSVERPDGTVVYLEAAQIAGMHRRGDDTPVPGPYGSYGVGQLLRAALRTRPAQIVLGIGDLAILDGGRGMLQALAGRAEDASFDLEYDLERARERVAGVGLTAATGQDHGLLGLQGASARTVELFGATRAWAQEQESAMGEYAARAGRLVPARTDLLSGAAARLDRQPGAGAGGGLGFGMALLGAHLTGGPALVAHTLGLAAAAARADVVVTVTETFDWRVLEHSVLQEVTRAAGAHARPAVVIAREVEVGRRETMSAGVSGTYPLYRPGPGRGRVEDVDVVTGLRSLARRVAGTWTPPPRRDVP